MRPPSDRRHERADVHALLERLSGGDRVAFVDLARLVTGFLARWHAYDFRDEWDDLVQEVILAAVQAHRKRSLRTPEAAIGYLRSSARFKFVDWLRRRRGEPLPDEDAGAGPMHWPPAREEDEAGFQIWDKLRALPELQQKALVLVYVEGRTYEEASAASGIPLGSLKRYLREGLAALRKSLADFVDAGDPSGRPAPTLPWTSAPEDPAHGEGRRGSRTRDDV